MRGRWNDSVKESVRRKADARRQRELAVARARENALAWEAKIQKGLTAKTRSITEQWVDQVIENSDLSFRLVLRQVRLGAFEDAQEMLDRLVLDAEQVLILIDDVNGTRRMIGPKSKVAAYKVVELDGTRGS